MSSLSFGFDVGYSTTIAGAIILVVLAVHLVPYVVDRRGMRSIPGPWLAKFSDAWLGRISARGHKSDVIRELHRQYGTFLRIAPNHVSIAKPEALRVIYGHSTGGLKAPYYDATSAKRPSTFASRNPVEHSRKRKMVSDIFSLKSVLEYEPNIRIYAEGLVRQWDKLAESGKKGLSGDEGNGWFGRDGRVWCDALPWYNYLTLDTISDLSFGSPFDMLKAASDVLPLVKSHTGAVSYGDGSAKGHVEYFPIVKVIRERGYFVGSLGDLPKWTWPLMKKFHPWYRMGDTAAANLLGLAITVVSNRLETPTDRVDVLGKLIQGKDHNGKTMDIPELAGEAAAYIGAATGTTSSTSTAITHYLAKNPAAQFKLQAELDEALGHEDDPVAPWAVVKSLPYLDAVVNEGLRLFCAFSIGLPRVTPKGGLYVLGKFFPEGTILSTPIYTIHRDPEIWGPDAEAFRPERWFELDQSRIQEIFYPFSHGPRACMARNLVMVKLRVFMATVFRRYEFVLENPSEQLPTLEGVIRRPTACRVGMKRREV